MFDHHIYCLAGEAWKDIPGYEGIYQASSLGRIRTVDGKKTHTDRHGERTWKGKVLKSRGESKIGYRVSLWNGKTPKDFLVARLVGFAFHGVPDDPKMTINHKDGNRFNNCADNLEWLTIAENIRHGFATGLYSSCRRVKLRIAGEVFEFGSHAEANRYIGRSPGYIQDARRVNGTRTKSGEVVEVL